MALFMGPSSSAAFQTKENKIIKRAAHQSFIVPHVALARALPPPGRQCQLGGITGSAQRRSDVTPGWTSQCRPVSLNPDPCERRLWAPVTRAPPPHLSGADWLRAAAENQAGPGSLVPHLEGAPRWIIQTVPVATISADMFPCFYTHTHRWLNIHHGWRGAGRARAA